MNLTKVVTHLATRCLWQGVHLTRGQPDQSSKTFDNKMSVSRGTLEQSSA